MKKSIFLFIFTVFLFSYKQVYADDIASLSDVNSTMADIFVNSLSESQEKKLLSELSKNDSRFSNYSDLMIEYPNLKYYFYKDNLSGDYIFSFVNRSSDAIFYKKGYIDVPLSSNKFVGPNSFYFDQEMNFKASTTMGVSLTSYIKIYNGLGFYSNYESAKPFFSFENYDSSQSDPVEEEENGKNFFDKMLEIISNPLEFIKKLFVPADEDSNFFSNTFDFVSSGFYKIFKPIFNASDDILSVFTPEIYEGKNINSFNSKQISDDFYFLEFEVFGYTLRPFRSLNSMREQIYFISNGLLIFITLLYSMRRIFGTGDVIKW